MNNTLGRLVLLTALAAPATLHAAKAYVIEDIEQVHVSNRDYRPLSASEVKAAVIGAATSLGWIVTEAGSESIKLRFERSSARASFWVVIEVPYRDGSFGIRYVDSEGLRFREGGGQRVIHGSYKRWIDNLVVRVQSGDGPPAPAEETLD